MKKILITGSSGYIGTNFINRYNNIFEFKLCDKNTSLPHAQSLEIKYIEDCIGVIHFAALSGIPACEANPGIAIIDNILSAGNIFSLALKRGIPVVFTSSQAAKDPSSSVYANMKWSCEKMANYYNNNMGGSIYIVRLANVYGGYQYLEKKQTCVKQFITKYKRGVPLEVHGNGHQIRDFVHVWDVCEAIYLLLTKKPYCRMPIDIGTGKGISILDLVKMFPRNKNHHYSFSDSRSAGADSSIADTSVLEKLTGFVPQRSLEDYIKENLK